jgi:hypothetical protein
MHCDDDILRVLAHQRHQAGELERHQAKQAQAADAAIARTEALIRALDVRLPIRRGATARSEDILAVPNIRPWDAISADAREQFRGPISMADVLTADELHLAMQAHAALNAEFDSLHALDTFDWCVAGAAGTFGALIDAFLVRVPSHPAFLGGPAESGGWLSNGMKTVVGKMVPEDTLRRLEKNYRVCYDASTSSGLDTPIPGLGPGTHRFQSLGHDPLLAWVFGVRDLLNGEFMAIGKNGQLIVQGSRDPLMVGEALLRRIIEALRLVAGHLASDVATSRGLPAPLMPLLLFIQRGAIGKHGYTVSELAREMYRSGYDFRHFLASSLPVLIIEDIVRLAHFAKVLSNGGDLAAAAPGSRDPKLQTQLFIAHTIAAATNAGKVEPPRGQLVAVADVLSLPCSPAALAARRGRTPTVSPRRAWVGAAVARDRERPPEILGESIRRRHRPNALTSGERDTVWAGLVRGPHRSGRSVTEEGLDKRAPIAMQHIRLAKRKGRALAIHGAYASHSPQPC